MKILTINCGSSSVKYQFINLEDKFVMAEGICEKIAEGNSLFTYKSEKFTVKKQAAELPSHQEAIKLILDSLQHPQNGCISDISEIDAVGHRLVHAGEHYNGTVLIDDHVISVMEDCIPLAPLHNPANIVGVKAMQTLMPDTPQCGLFDTAFHQTMPPKAYLYPLPYEYYTKNKIRRYGFHGTSHKFVAQQAAQHLNIPIDQLKIITCHAGNGASITAIDRGESVDTSMGFTPLEGLVMGTRCGDLDPAIPLYMQRQFGLSVDEVDTILNKKSGILGLSEMDSDMRPIEDGLDNGDPDAIRAFEVYCYRIKKYIGAYTAAMNGLDVLVFTGGVGENMPHLRDWVCRDMEYLGIKFNNDVNYRRGSEIFDLHQPDSEVKVLKISTNEELMIALETEKLLNSRS
ncbi:MAG: acetate kinase [Candidatus Stygibacter australis]|nr:acetate kinase [Candidatus Stygibacter australis]MDP8322127.1 acetate kinase [Candidatus Stygibacter australis]